VDECVISLTSPRKYGEPVRYDRKWAYRRFLHAACCRRILRCRAPDAAGHDGGLDAFVPVTGDAFRVEYGQRHWGRLYVGISLADCRGGRDAILSVDATGEKPEGLARMVKKLDLLESDHGCGPSGLSWESIPKRK
jgi:hypothetical protein